MIEFGALMCNISKNRHKGICELTDVRRIINSVKNGKNLFLKSAMVAALLFLLDLVSLSTSLHKLSNISLLKGLSFSSRVHGESDDL